jgi:hypothetical protein
MSGAGNLRRNSSAAGFIAACAMAIVTPDFSRAAISKRLFGLVLFGSAFKGSQVPTEGKDPC